MSPYLGLVVNAPQADAHESATHRARDRFAEGSFPNPGRANQAKNGASPRVSLATFAQRAQTLDRQVFEHA